MIKYQKYVVFGHLGNEFDMADILIDLSDHSEVKNKVWIVSCISWWLYQLFIEFCSLFSLHNTKLQIRILKLIIKYCFKINCVSIEWNAIKIVKIIFYFTVWRTKPYRLDPSVMLDEDSAWVTDSEYLIAQICHPLYNNK